MYSVAYGSHWYPLYKTYTLEKAVGIQLVYILALVYTLITIKRYGCLSNAGSLADSMKQMKLSEWR